jgi:hypothetical protein
MRGEVGDTASLAFSENFRREKPHKSIGYSLGVKSWRNCTDLLIGQNSEYGVFMQTFPFRIKSMRSN